MTYFFAIHGLMRGVGVCVSVCQKCSEKAIKKGARETK